MAIEKMSFVHLKIDYGLLDSTLLTCLGSGVFHPQIPSSPIGSASVALDAQNPYDPLLKRIEALSHTLSLSIPYIDCHNAPVDLEEVKNYLDTLEKKANSINSEHTELSQSVSMHKSALKQLEHLKSLNENFDDLFACKYVKIRFGRLPEASYKKLEYFENRTFFFFPLDRQDDYYWCLYLAPDARIRAVDDIFQALYFERIRVPDYVHGTPNDAFSAIENVLSQEQEKLKESEENIKSLKTEIQKPLQTYACWLKFKNETFSLRRYALLLDKRFYLYGFVPERDAAAFRESVEQPGVHCSIKPPEIDGRLKTPVKLKNNKFVRPFEMYTEMYGLPSYDEIDPTPFVAITYTLLFGIMFGDLGQGLLLSLIGYAMWKFKKMMLGRILMRVGISSAFFGFWYGSVFGFEHLLDPVFKALFGLPHKPIEVFESSTTNMLLIAAIGLGAVILIVSILINIILGLRKKEYDRAFFSNNGIAGLVFYAFVCIAAVCMFAFNVDLLNPVMIILFIAIPLLVMFFKTPLTKIIKKRGDIKPPEGWGGYIIENFFEVFEYVLSFITNTMSFLRVGGFILSHAGMMTVVMTLMEIASGGASPVILVIGNIFVIALEGLLVGIQVLRLEFYEIFSRFFEGNGVPFTPAAVSETTALSE